MFDNGGAAEMVGLILAAFFIALIVNGWIRSLVFFIFYAIIVEFSVVIMNNNADQFLEEFASLFFFSLALVAINISSNKLTYHAIEKFKDAKFKPIRVGFDDNRFLLILRLWIFTLLVTSTIGYLKSKNVDLVSKEFYVSWCVNVAFFSVIGFAVAIVSLRIPEKEEFKDRIGFLFAAKIDSDPELRAAALEHISNDIKKIGFVCLSIDRKVTVVEYSKDFDGYRAYVTVKTTLINLFGDTEAKDDTNFQIMPDQFGDTNKQPKLIGQVVSLVVAGEEKIRNGPLDIDKIDGIKFKEKFSVNKENTEFTLKYWAWFKVGVEAAYTSRRFCRTFSLSIVNRIKDESSAEVRFQKLGENAQRPSNLRYNEVGTVHEITNMEPGIRYSLFKFEDPNAEAR